MYAREAYRQQRETSASRIDVILSIYEAARGRIGLARELLASRPGEANSIL